jgi:hypothetical protein
MIEHFVGPLRIVSANVKKCSSGGRYCIAEQSVATLPPGMAILFESRQSRFFLYVEPLPAGIKLAIRIRQSSLFGL